MKKNRKIIIIIVVAIALITGITFGVYKLFKDENGLSIIEKTWINKNRNSVFTIFVPNDINVFGKSGVGVFYDFISDLEEEMDFKLNSAVYSINDENNSLGFNIDTKFDNNDLLLYTDYYVLVNKIGGTLFDINDLKSSKVGIIEKDLSYIADYYTLTGTINTYANSDDLFNALESGEVDYITLPRNQYKDLIVSKDYNICYYFNDAKVYYYLHLGNDKTLNSIMVKFYNNWIKDDFKESFNENNYQLFLNSLSISDIEEDELTDKTINFSYIVSQPYQLLSKGDFSGVASEYLNSFIEFSDIDFKYKKLDSLKELKKYVKNKKVDLYFNQYNYDNEYQKMNINLNVDYLLLSNINNQINLDSLKAYVGEVYVLENSILYSYLSNYSDITIKTYSKDSKIKSLIKNNKLVIVDKLSYEHYFKDKIKNEHIILDSSTNLSYTFNYRISGDIFSKLFKSYVNFLNPKEVVDNGLHRYFKVYESSNRTVSLAKYLILFIIVGLVSIYLFLKSKSRIVLNTKVKNNEKIRYVDMLTCLKNRNYLNDRIEIWNQNTVYPQCVIVLDLNNIKYLNDTFGHEEGDKQIKSVANVLFKTQLENTELLRTDGNEFMVYMVGYSEKKVVSYIKKLLKEFKKLPYEYGVAVGFSMIEDDLKLVEDAFNEATLMMRKNKTAFEDNDVK